MYRVDDDGKLYCDRHSHAFERTGACPSCVEDPGAPVDEDDEAVKLPAPPVGCESTEDIEREYVSRAKEVHSLILSLKRGKPRKGRNGEEREGKPVLDNHTCNTIAKLYDVWTKLKRQAYACAQLREAEAIVARREREKREIERGAAH